MSKTFYYSGLSDVELVSGRHLVHFLPFLPVLQAPHSRVESVAFQQRFVISAFDHLAFVEHDDFVVALHAVEAVGDGEYCSALARAVEGVEQGLLGDGVEVGDYRLREPAGTGSADRRGE